MPSRAEERSATLLADAHRRSTDKGEKESQDAKGHRRIPEGAPRRMSERVAELL
jgi:hypothetical protein